MFEVLTHGKDSILSFGVLGLMSGEWVIYRELLYQPTGRRTQLKERVLAKQTSIHTDGVSNSLQARKKQFLITA